VEGETMATSVPVEHVLNVQQMSFGVLQTPDMGAGPALLQVYTGMVEQRLQSVDDDFYAQDRILSFVPIREHKLLDMSSTPQDDFFSTVTVKVTTITEEEDKNFFSVDNAFAQLQSQPQLPGHPRCIVLTIDVGVLLSTIQRLSYHVTVLTNHTAFNPDFIDATGHGPA